MLCIPIWLICNMLGVRALVSLVLIQAIRYLRMSQLPERLWLILPHKLLVRWVQEVYYQFQLLQRRMLASSLLYSVSLLPVNSSLTILLFMYMSSIWCRRVQLSDSRILKRMEPLLQARWDHSRRKSVDSVSNIDIPLLCMNIMIHFLVFLLHEYSFDCRSNLEWRGLFISSSLGWYL